MYIVQKLKPSGFRNGFWVFSLSMLSLCQSN